MVTFSFTFSFCLFDICLQTPLCKVEVVRSHLVFSGLFELVFFSFGFYLLITVLPFLFFFFSVYRICHGSGRI